MNPRRIARLQQQIKHRIAEVLQRELADPRHGMITITKVEIDKEFTVCKAYWSSLNDESGHAADRRFLQRATAYVQRAVAASLHTRTVPKLSFHHDESIAGAIEMQSLLHRLRREREEREERQGQRPDAGPAADAEA